MTRRIATAAAALMMLSLVAPARARGDDEAVSRSVVRIFSTKRSPDLYRPWRKKDGEDLTGTGVVIEGRRVLTNAHVAEHATRLLVQADRTGDRLPATVEAIAYEMDLAVLKVDDPAFFDEHPPLPRAEGLPHVGEAVLAYGYPHGGETLSATRGIVSRIEFAEYSYRTMGLRIQIDAAVNPGNSGGPVVVDGRMVGVVFSGLDQSDNIGYIIPGEEIDLFLKDVSDGKYDGKPWIYDRLQYIENAAIRAKLGLRRGVNGLLVREPDRDEPSYPLKRWDVITHISGYPIDADGKVVVEGGLRIQFSYLIQRTAEKGTVHLDLLRDGKKLAVDLPVTRRRHRPRVIRPLEGLPPYLVWGPLVFTVVSEEYVEGFEETNNAPDWLPRLIARKSPIALRRQDRPAFEGEELVVVPELLPHRLVQGYDENSVVVDEVDGVKVKNLRHLAERLRDATGDRVTITFRDTTADILVIDRKGALAASEEILAEFGIRKAYSDDLKGVFEAR
jgi:S1-C subfamily serine protease